MDSWLQLPQVASAANSIKLYRRLLQKHQLQDDYTDLLYLLFLEVGRISITLLQNEEAGNNKYVDIMAAHLKAITFLVNKWTAITGRQDSLWSSHSTHTTLQLVYPKIRGVADAILSKSDPSVLALFFVAGMPYWPIHKLAADLLKQLN